jgi:hypothetical protein
MEHNHPWGNRKPRRNWGAHYSKRPVTLATSLGKTSKAEAEYVNYSRTNNHCEDCVMFIFPVSCTKVAGNISMVGTCRFWEAKK